MGLFWTIAGNLVPKHFKKGAEGASSNLAPFQSLACLCQSLNLEVGSLGQTTNQASSGRLWLSRRRWFSGESLIGTVQESRLEMYGC